MCVESKDVGAATPTSFDSTHICSSTGRRAGEIGGAGDLAVTTNGPAVSV